MRDCISFVLNGRLETLRNVPPATTLLNYLRKTQRCTGTKEGCAEGDCGACTVVIGELDATASCAHRAVNACIQFCRRSTARRCSPSRTCSSRRRAASGAAGAGRCHGSQCGFCTPGFVMSLYATYLQAQPTPAARRIDDALAGNLCRCTGYRPIIDAAQAHVRLPRAAFDATRAGRASSCKRIARDGETLHRMRGGAASSTPAHARRTGRICARASRGARILAGSTDVGPWVTKQLRDLADIIYVGRVAELQRVDDGGGSCAIGAGVTLEDA